MIEDSDMFRPCRDPGPLMKSCFSIFGELRGDAVLKEDECADEGVGKSVPVFGERLASTALTGGLPLEVAELGVVS